MIPSDTPVEALMSRQPVTVTPEDSVADALALLERYPFRHLPVVSGNELVGIVSDRDLVLAAALPRGRRAQHHGARTLRRVEEIVRRPVLGVPPSTPARAAVQLMLERRLGALPVVSGSLLLGIVTETDVLRLFERCAESTGSGAPSETIVESCMSRPVETVAPDEDVLVAADRLQASRVRHLPVVAGDALVGMLSDRDVRRALARLVREDRRVEATGSADVPRLTVEDVMTTPCLTIQRDRTLRAVAQVLLANRIGALVVLHREERVGIVTQTDLLEHFRDWTPFSS